MRVAKPAAGLDDMEHEYMLSHALQYIITHCTELHQKFSTFQHPSDYTLQRIARRVTGAWHREASLQDNTTLAEHDDTTSSTALHNPSEQLYQQSHIQNIHTARPLPSKPLKKAPPQYIPKPQITEPPRQGPHKTQDIYVEHRQDLEAIVREPNVNYYHVENYLRTKGYVGGFRPTRILQFTLDQMREYAFRTAQRWYLYSHVSIGIVGVIDSGKTPSQMRNFFT
jgi:hypothetical protein